VIQNYNSKNTDIQSFVETEFNIWQYLFQNQPLSEVKERLPNGSAYLVLQLDHNSESLYMGISINH